MYLENKILHFGPSVIFFFSFKILLRYLKTEFTGIKHLQGGHLPAPTYLGTACLGQSVRGRGHLTWVKYLCILICIILVFCIIGL